MRRASTASKAAGRSSRATRLVMATSGTSGDPKGVVLTHAAVAASAEATSRRLAVDPDA